MLKYVKASEKLFLQLPAKLQVIVGFEGWKSLFGIISTLEQYIPAGLTSGDSFNMVVSVNFNFKAWCSKLYLYKFVVTHCGNCN